MIDSKTLFFLLIMSGIAGLHNDLGRKDRRKRNKEKENSRKNRETDNEY